MNKLKTALSLSLAAVIAFTMNPPHSALAADTTFASLHAALDTNEDDAYYFATDMQTNNWTPTITCRYSRYCRVGTCDHLSNANATIVYWSGHGLSDGTFSYYTTPVASHNADRTDPAIVNGFVSYGSSTRKYQDYIGTLQTNNATDWLVLASCNQMTNSSQRDVYKNILRTRSQRPMKGIIGYGAGALAPDYTDNDIAKEFVRLSFDTTGRRRVVYAWMQANLKYGYTNSTALVNSSKIDDTLTSTKTASNISTSVPLPTISYVYYNSSNVVTIQTQSMVTEGNGNVLTEIPLSGNISEGKVLAESSKINLETQNQLIEIESDINVDLNGFAPYMKAEMIAEGENGSKEIIENSMIFARFINGIRVSTLPGKGEQIIRTSSPDGTSSIDYSIIQGISTEYMVSNTSKPTAFDMEKSIGIIDESTALKMGQEISKKLVTLEYLGVASISKSEVVYVMTPNKDKLVLAWELLDTYGNYIYIDAVTGQPIEWSQTSYVE